MLKGSSKMVNSNRFEVRRFDPETDLDAAYRCYKSGFYRGMWPLIDHAEPRLLKDSESSWRFCFSRRSVEKNKEFMLNAACFMEARRYQRIGAGESSQ